MKWFMNLRIRIKLILSFGAVIILAGVLAFLAIFEINTVNSEYETIFNGAVARRGAANNAQSEARAMRRTVTASVMHSARPESEAAARTESLDALRVEAVEMLNHILASLDEYDYSVRNQHGTTISWQNDRLSMSNGVRQGINEYFSIFEEVQSYARVGDFENAFHVTTDNAHVITTIVSDIARMVELANIAMTESTAEAAHIAHSAIIELSVITAVVVVVALIMAFLIAHVVSKPVHKLVDLIDNVSVGEFNVNMNRENLSTDEIGTLTKDVYILIDTIKAIVSDVNRFSHEINVNGDIDYRINASLYKGGYNEMVTSLNSFTESFVGDLLKVVNVIHKVGSGDFSMDIEKMPGKKIVVNDSVNALKDNLTAVIDEIDEMVDATAVKGKLDFYIDDSMFEGGWRKIMIGLNSVAKAVDAPISEISEVMSSLSKGGFDKKITGSYAGDFKDLSNSINETISAISGYLAEVRNILTAISQGDLTKSMDAKMSAKFTERSFTEITNAINGISNQLNKTISEILTASEQVLTGAKQISTSAQSLANGAQEQASSVEELNATIDTINQQTQQNADSAFKANELSHTSTANAEGGNESMKEMLKAMSQIKESSNDIFKIIKVIQEISFQTNLLALNAAVEAARAGEHGKGFSVVAEEVRTLAGRSQTSASETTNLIENSIERVEIGSSIAEATSASLDRIVTNASEVAGIISDIAIASKEQADAIAQVSLGLDQISRVVQGNSAVSEETAAASQELSSQAELLQELVSYFKL